MLLIVIIDFLQSCGFTPKHWESLLRKILSKQEALPNWKENITGS